MSCYELPGLMSYPVRLERAWQVCLDTSSCLLRRSCESPWCFLRFHVGIGSDFDGVPALPQQLEDVSTYPVITQGLLDRGYKAAEIRKLLGENVMRVFRETEQVAASL